MAKLKAVPRLNQVFAMLVKTKTSQTAVANALGISSQSLGYYLRGRKIPATVIQKWQEVYNQNLIEISRLDFETNLDTIISKGTQAAVKNGGTHNGGHKDSEFQRKVEAESINVEQFRQLQKDHEMFEKELNRAWDLIDRLLPKSKTQPVKRVDTNEGK